MSGIVFPRKHAPDQSYIHNRRQYIYGKYRKFSPNDGRSTPGYKISYHTLHNKSSHHPLPYRETHILKTILIIIYEFLPLTYAATFLATGQT
jgi:hypothetical protein